jgi:enamine deaminase RidA (YjgF/YER057c/UK114 family)
METLSALEHILPVIQKPVANYVLTTRVGALIYTSGILPMRDGILAYTGRLGDKLSVQEGQEASKLCILNTLSILKQELGELSRIKQIVKLTGFVNSTPDFTQHPAVINGASDFLVSLFTSKHARSAVGVSSLPLNAAVEIELIVEVSL